MSKPIHFFTMTCCFLLLIIFTLPVQAAVPPEKAKAIHYEKATVLSVTQPPTATGQHPAAPSAELVTLQMRSGSAKGQVVNALNFFDPRSPYTMQVAIGDKVLVAVSERDGVLQYRISDFDRLDYVYWLVALFVLSLLVFARMTGVRSVFVLAFSAALIFYVYIQQVLHGAFNLTLLTLAISSAIALVTQVSISGWNRKSVSAILGTIGGVAIAGLLSILFIHLMHLTGLESEEAMLLKAARLNRVDFQGVLFSGMVFGALGAVMDVTISISSALQEVKTAHPSISRRELFLTGMNVGRDIMGTMSNTLILAYMGTGLPLMLLIASQPEISMLRVMNLNLIVTEITRAMTGSIGLVCAIPLTALIASFLLHRSPPSQRTRQRENA